VADIAIADRRELGAFGDNGLVRRRAVRRVDRRDLALACPEKERADRQGEEEKDDEKKA
jgi:hypothetical protein